MNTPMTGSVEYRIAMETKVAGPSGFEFRPLTVDAGNEVFAEKIAGMFRSDSNYRNVVIQKRKVVREFGDWEKTEL